MHSPLTFNIPPLSLNCFREYLGADEQLRRVPVKATYHVTSAEVARTGHPSALPLVDIPLGLRLGSGRRYSRRADCQT
jgi:hypothetical protein